MRIYITRHGKTKWNTIKKLQGWNDSPLTKEGIERAEKLADRLKSIDFDSIYSSPQKRALHTAEILNTKNIEIQQLDEFKELKLGKWEGMIIDEVEKKYPKQFYLYFNKPHLYEPLGGETFNELFFRVKNALKQIISTRDKNVLIVSHGVTINAIIAILKEMKIEELGKMEVYPGTSLTIFEIEDDKVNCLLEGDDSHLL